MSNTLNLQTSICPNGMQVDADGYAVFYPLGTNKVDIPTTEDGWPVGDTLISPFVYKNDKLVGFCDTKAMTAKPNTTVTIPYEHIEADFPSIKEGNITLNTPNAVTKKLSWFKLGDKYITCKSPTEVSKIDSNWSTNDIKDGVWSESLERLEKQSIMSMGNIVIRGMFYNLTNLTTFISDLSSLKNGGSMFSGCTALTSFDAKLSSLTDGTMMFSKCKLDSTSIKNIFNTINVVESGNLELGLGCDDTTEDKNIFAQEIGYPSFDSLLADFSSKGWTVFTQFNGRPVTTNP